MPNSTKHPKIQINEESINEHMGRNKLQEFINAANKLDDPITRLNKNRIRIYISASENAINYELKNDKGQSLLKSKQNKAVDCNPLSIISYAILNGFYIVNKEIAHTIDLIKS